MSADTAETRNTSRHVSDHDDNGYGESVQRCASEPSVRNQTDELRMVGKALTVDSATSPPQVDLESLKAFQATSAEVDGEVHPGSPSNAVAKREPNVEEEVAREISEVDCEVHSGSPSNGVAKREPNVEEEVANETSFADWPVVASKSEQKIGATLHVNDSPAAAGAESSNALDSLHVQGAISNTTAVEQGADVIPGPTVYSQMPTSRLSQVSMDSYGHIPASQASIGSLPEVMTTDPGHRNRSVPVARAPGVNFTAVRRRFRPNNATTRRHRRNFQLAYPNKLKVLMIIVASSSFGWLSNFWMSVWPAVTHIENDPCKESTRLANSALTLFIFFAWLVLTRISLFHPTVAQKVARLYAESHDFCKTYCFQLLVRDGPLYFFIADTMLFWFHVKSCPAFEKGNPNVYEVIRVHTMASCVVSALYMVFSFWHNKILIGAAPVPTAQRRKRVGATPGTLEKLESRRYEDGMFNDEENGGVCTSEECSICLVPWEQGQMIKVTPCSHAFHEECIGTWLKSARTCALCRFNLEVAAVAQADADTRSPNPTTPPPIVSAS